MCRIHWTVRLMYLFWGGISFGKLKIVLFYWPRVQLRLALLILWFCSLQSIIQCRLLAAAGSALRRHKFLTQLDLKKKQNCTIPLVQLIVKSRSQLTASYWEAFRVIVMSLTWIHSLCIYSICCHLNELLSNKKYKYQCELIYIYR